MSDTADVILAVVGGLIAGILVTYIILKGTQQPPATQMMYVPNKSINTAASAPVPAPAPSPQILFVPYPTNLSNMSPIPSTQPNDTTTVPTTAPPIITTAQSNSIVSPIQAIENDESWEFIKDKMGKITGVKGHRKVKPIV